MSKYSTSQRNYLIDFLAIVFGIGAWVAVNGIWVELPILVEALPEQWSLPSYLSVITQVANIGPIAFGILHKFFPRIVHETSATFVMMFIGIIACLLLGLFWQSTLIVNQESHSVALFALVFFVSLVDCTSSVVFLPFMGMFKEIYLLSYFIGEGLSGFLPSIVALVQGVGGNPICNTTTYINYTDVGNITEYITTEYVPDPNFSVDIFFYFLCGMMAASFAAFVFLRYLPTATKEHIGTFNEKVGHENNAFEESSSSGDSGISQESSNIYLTSDAMSTSYGTDDQLEITRTKLRAIKVDSTVLKSSTYMYLLFIQAWLSFFQNGVLLSIQSYSCLPYGNLAYHLTVTLSNIANPIACFVAFFLPSHHTGILSLETTIASLIGAYILTLAVQSPYPPLTNSVWGIILVVAAWILFIGLASHVKASLATVFRKKSTRALFWCGAVTQIGSAIGSVLMFLLVNVYYFFHSYDPCFT